MELLKIRNIRNLMRIGINLIFVTVIIFAGMVALDLRTGWDLNDPAQRAKMLSHLQRERPILIVGSWSGLGTRTTHMRWMIDVYRWLVSQGVARMDSNWLSAGA